MRRRHSYGKKGNSLFYLQQDISLLSQCQFYTDLSMNEKNAITSEHVATQL